MTLVARALYYATAMHDSQVRKYTGEPYVTHTIAVKDLVEQYYTDRQEVLAAALLHDVVEDTAATHKNIQDEFGHEVAKMVFYLTDVSKPEDGNRALRKKLDREHVLRGDFDVHSIKLADLIHNANSILEHDQNFGRVFMTEKKMLLEKLNGCPKLTAIARDIMNRYEEGKDA